jgi:hypothetical protein
MLPAKAINVITQKLVLTEATCMLCVWCCHCYNLKILGYNTVFCQDCKY